MKFKTKFGIGEIVEYNVYKGQELINSELLKVKAITFTADGLAAYLCEYPASGIQKYFDECEIIGDPDFDQETGAYPREIDDESV